MGDNSKIEWLEWLRGKLADAEKALSARNEASACWQGGNSQSWREVGCKMTKAQRLTVSEREARIAVKCARDVANYKAVIEALSHSNDTLCREAGQKDAR
jgi:hypothetical protein